MPRILRRAARAFAVGLACVVSLAVTTAAAQRPDRAASRYTAIRAGRLIDGQGGAPRTNVLIVVNGDRSATTVAADLLGWSDRVGSVQRDRFADLVAVKGDPLRDITVLEQPAWVMKGGVVCKGQGTVTVR